MADSLQEVILPIQLDYVPVYIVSISFSKKPTQFKNGSLNIIASEHFKNNGTEDELSF